MITFTDLGVPAPLVQRLARRGITAPFPIQAATIAEALAGRDLCGKAPTGSGKTLAFSIPIAARVGKARPGRPRALVLVPTRELASQVATELSPLLDGRRAATFYGGTSIGRDVTRLRSGVDVAVACPGRLADLVRQRAVSLADVDLVVIDEADRMADMGFLPEVKRLLDQTSPRRQTLLFSATLDGDVDVLVHRYQRDPAVHDLAGTPEETGDVRHLFWSVEPTGRADLAAQVVAAAAPAIVFTRTKRGADRLARQLAQRGVGAAAIHGNRSQSQRERALAQFSTGKVATLVATDVAARGIHVDDVGLVLHYDIAGTDKDYVHRSGRTGRAGADGLVLTFVTPDKAADAAALQRALALPGGTTRGTIAGLGAARPAGRQPAAAAAAVPGGSPALSRVGGPAASPARRRSGRPRR
ncbi:MAG: DEAD/DEAH box helicase [Actinobacteria bacterium]|nr:DEAD/DEAH box helicase [Actinomycetota bacterium]